MASKSKKAPSMSRDSINESGSFMLGDRSKSPISPRKYSRLAEKAELQSLNDRLAAYIDRNRSLEAENARLTAEVQCFDEHKTRETSNIKQMFERELGDARKLLDETAKEKAKLEIDTARLWEENGELKARTEKLKNDLNIAENQARSWETRCQDLQNKYNAANTDRKKAKDEAATMAAEIERLQKQLEELRNNLDAEIFERVNLENTLQSLREEITFKDQMHTQELCESRTRRQVEISEIDGRLSEEYEAKLQQSLQELRDQYESQIRANREEIEMLYDNKIKAFQNAASRNSSAANTAIEDLRYARSRIEGLTTRVNDLEGMNADLQARIRELEQLMDATRARDAETIANLEAELAKARDEMAQHLQEYQDLMDIKVSLDMELAAYDKLLQSEETRLNISTNSSHSNSVNQSTAGTTTTTASVTARRSSRSTPIRRTPLRQQQTLLTHSTLAGPSGPIGGIKRKRMTEETEDRSASEYHVTQSAKGDIEIADVDPEGKFVKLYNKSNKDLNIGGWQIVRTAGFDKETSFKLHRSVKIEANGIVTVWSMDAGVTHEPPHNIVMKSQKWFVSDNMKTVLINSDGEEVATSERIKHIVSTKVSRQRTAGGEEFLHAEVRPKMSSVPPTPGVDSEEKCTIM